MSKKRLKRTRLRMRKMGLEILSQSYKGMIKLKSDRGRLNNNFTSEIFSNDYDIFQEYATKRLIKLYAKMQTIQQHHP